ncbi:hypothetical protein ACWV26_08370 [Rummeliibacillus sp. JY-2-4R]
MKGLLIIGNFLMSGVITFFISLFFAEGAIAENYSNETYVAPEFFLIFGVWVIGAILLGLFFSKNKFKNTPYWKIFLVNILLWFTIPVGFFFSMMLANL